MMKKYKKQINNSAIYAMSSILAKAVPFLLLPIFTSYLSKEDYGVLGLIASIAGIVGIYVGLRPSLFVVVKGPQIPKNDLSRYLSNILFLSLFTFLIMLAFLLLTKTILFDMLDYYFLLLLALFALMNVANGVIETVFQIEKKAIHYAFLQITKTLLAVSLALTLIIVFSFGWKGKFFADVVVAFFIVLFAFGYLKRHHYLCFDLDRQRMKELVVYLFTLTFHALGLIMMASIDRIFLSNMLGLEATGSYTVAYTIGALIGIIHDALLNVWSPEFYKRIAHATQETKIKIVKFTYLYILFSIVLLVFFVAIAPYIFSVMIDAKFHDAYAVIPVVALGLTFEAVRKLLIGYYYNKGKNTLIAAITLFAGLLNALLNYLLIPVYGMDGAAYATLFSYAAVTVITFVILRRVEYIPWLLKAAR